MEGIGIIARAISFQDF